MSSKKPANEYQRMVAAFGYSVAGFRWVIRHPAFRSEMLGFLLLAPVGCFLAHNGIERALLVGSLLVVLIVELLNTAVEATIDRIGPEIHPLSKAAKDVGSLAVLLSLGLVVVIWFFVLCT